jgi:hypothetical protein
LCEKLFIEHLMRKKRIGIFFCLKTFFVQVQEHIQGGAFKRAFCCEPLLMLPGSYGGRD